MSLSENPKLSRDLLSDPKNYQTSVLLDYFGQINEGRPIEVGGQTLDEGVVVNGIKRGINIKEIRFHWFDEEQLPSKTAVVSLNKKERFVWIAVNEVLFGEIAQDSEAMRELNVYVRQKERGLLGRINSIIKGKPKSPFPPLPRETIEYNQRLVRNLVVDIYSHYRELD